MYDRLVEATTVRLLPYAGCAVGSEQYDKLRFGIYVLYINLLKTLLLIVVAILLGIVRYVLVFMLAYGALRLFSFGVHLKSSFACTALSLIYYFGGTMLSIHLLFHPAVFITIWMCSILAFFLYAPAETERRPIPRRQKRPFKKKALSVLAALFVLMLFSLHNNMDRYANLLTIAAACQAVNLLPITFKLAKGGYSK